MQQVVADEMTYENTDWENWLVCLVGLAKTLGADIAGSEDAWFNDYKAGLTPVESFQMFAPKPQ